ncbi:unnamed protein product, partial [Adineta steineri]
YHAAPLAGQFAHYTIRPMNMEHMKDFVNYWFFRVHQQIIDTLDLSVVNQGENHGEALKKELEKTENFGLLDVASNSCLMSFICSVAFNQLEGSPLPTQRILLYEQIVNSMLSLWNSKKSTIATEDLLRILSNIAIYIHEHSASGLIHEEKMKEVCNQSIKSLSNRQSYIDDQASEFIRIIREDVGILAARGESIYGFLHLTFQEYFTCLKLVDENKTERIANSLLRHIYDPRFRVPISLALGKISYSWSQIEFDDFCMKFIEQENQSDSLLPLGAFMIINCSKDFVIYPSNKIMFYALDCLIIAAGQHKWSITCPFLIDQIRLALKKLQNDMVASWINIFLSRSTSYDVQTISALCHLIEGKSHEFEYTKWLNQSSCSILQFLSKLDNENNEFAIDRLLIKIAFSNHRLLPLNPTTFKSFLITEEIELNSIPIDLFPLIITLYGGLKRDNTTIVFDPFRIHRESTLVTPVLIHFLTMKIHNKQDQSIFKITQEFFKIIKTQIQNHNDENSDVVDVCLAVICLNGIDYVRQNAKFITNSLFHMCMKRLKYISMILRQFYFTNNSDDRSVEDETTKIISTVMKKCSCGEFSTEEFLHLLNLLKSGLARLRSSTTSMLIPESSQSDERVILDLPNSLRKEYEFLYHLLSEDDEFYFSHKSCSLLHHFTKLFWILEHNDEFDTQFRMAVVMDTIPEYLIFQNDQDLLFVLTFIPDHLRNLYLQLLKQRFVMINSKDNEVNEIEHLHFSHILLECLIVLSNTSCKRLSLLAALISLQPMLRVHHLENFGSSLLWTLATEYSDYLSMYENSRKYPMNYKTGLYMNKVEEFPDGDNMKDQDRRIIIDKCIEQEHERLENALDENYERNMKLYSSCISLAFICQWAQNEHRLCLLKESIQGAMSIKNKLVRLDALSMIYFYSNYEQTQINENKSLQQEIEHQLNDIYTDLPLLLHTAILIRCLPLLENQQIIDNCFKNLSDKFINADHQDQQVVYEALSPYIQFNTVFLPKKEYMLDYHGKMNNRSSILNKYFNISSDEDLSSLFLVSSMYLTELAGELHDCTTDNSFVTTLFQFDSRILTVGQALTITNYLSSVSSLNQSKDLENICIKLSNTLHYFDFIEFKAHRLLESWLKWKDSSNELSLFAYHAALLLVNSHIWSVEITTIVCDLLSTENDRFRQRAEIILRSNTSNTVRTSSKLGIDVLLTLAKKLAHYQHFSPFSALTLNRMFDSITIDIQSHLDTFLWLERYRLHTLINKEYSLIQPTSLSMSYICLYFPTDITIDIIHVDNIRRLSDDLVQYMCDLIKSNFLSFLEIDGDTTSSLVLQSHVQFVVSILVCLVASIRYEEETRPQVIDVLITLVTTSQNNKIRRAAVYALGYICNKSTYKILFKELQILITDGINDIRSDSNSLIDAFITSYCNCISICDIEFDKDDMDLFSMILKDSPTNLRQTIHIGLGRVLKNNSQLLEILNSNCIEIRQFNNDVHHIRTIEYYLANGQPRYVEIAELVAVRMPAAFCGYIQDCGYGDSFKRALFYTSKQHNFPQRAACITILSMFGELTVELCEMIIVALQDDSHIQNTCYKCLTRINSIKDEKVVLNLLFSYLKSKSMNIRYITTKLLIHLSQSSLVSSEQVQKVLNDLMLDPNSNESLWLTEEQEGTLNKCHYYYAGSLKDVIYSLLIQNLTRDKSGAIRRNELNDIDSAFIEAERASRLASCVYEKKREENLEIEKPSKIKSID